MKRRAILRKMATAGMGAVVGAPVVSAWAQAAFPAQPIRWIVPYPPAGGTDVLARVLADAMRPSLGQPLQIDNRPGASTNLGAQIAAAAKPDGYTILSVDNAVLAFNEFLFSNLPFRPDKSFSYIGGISRFPLVLVVNPEFSAKTVKEFIAYARARPGQLSYASPGNGSPHHLAMEMFKARTGTFITHIPYRGAAPAMNDLIARKVPCMFLALAGGLPVVKSGQVRVLAVGSSSRVPQLPGVPTLAEAGVANSEVFAFQGLLGPAGMPGPIVARLNQELNKALASAEVRRRMDELGMESLSGTPEQFFAYARAEAKRWGAIIQARGVTLD